MTLEEGINTMQTLLKREEELLRKYAEKYKDTNDSDIQSLIDNNHTSIKLFNEYIDTLK